MYKYIISVETQTQTGGGQGDPQHYIWFRHINTGNGIVTKLCDFSLILFRTWSPKSCAPWRQKGLADSPLPHSSGEFEPEAKPELKKPLDPSEISIGRNFMEFYIKFY